MVKKMMVMVLVMAVCLAGCATTKPVMREDVAKGVDAGLEATYWATYAAGKILEIPKLASGGPAPVMVFDTGLKAILIPVGLAIKANKASKSKSKGMEKGSGQNNQAETGPSFEEQVY